MRRLACLLALLVTAEIGFAQQSKQQPQTGEARLRQQREELERVRRERADLQRRMSTLQTRAHDLTEEVRLINRQRSATTRLVRSLDQQLAAITDEVRGTTVALVQAEDESNVKKAVLQRRLADIYKRGPLYTAEVLFSAQSFGDLVTRYKYLHLLAQRDRALVRRVEELRERVARSRQQLVRLQADIEHNRSEKAREEERLRTLEQREQLALRRVQQDATRTRRRLEQLAATERRLNQFFANLEAERRRAAARANAPARAPSTIRTADLGRLAWPVEGTIIYRFGRVVNPNNTTTRWNGIGIAAAQGTPVRAVSSGTVVLSEVMGTYGNTIIVEHGGGDYSVYGALSRMDARKGARIIKGQVIGAVGATDPELPAHLHFEIRRGGPAVDPLEWLRAQ
ncbi:MAG TPA: peptidoglycan DD-metalloendopeptidase family protein [Gemmatimonadaceae bacterium]|nr:peptidoglycan DD-metalloendopeptidase family protein [Gemmatimonadaceae bacterium]